MVNKFKVNGKLLFLSLILAGTLYPAGAQLGLSDLPAGAKRYVQSDKYPGIVIPYLGGKLDSFLYAADSELQLSDTVLQRCINIAGDYDKDPAKTLRALREYYSLSSDDEALILVDWAKLITQLSVLDETVIVQQGEEKYRKLTARYAAAKEELDNRLSNNRNLRVRRQGFAATRQLIGYLDKEVKAAEELHTSSSLEAPDPSLMIDVPAKETTQ
jgi:hypothetical protein